ncbi:MAG: TrkH family potassium uptake protein [Lachnospiraceae bacterium]
MNRGMIIFILGWVLKIEAVLMLLPLAVALIYREQVGIWFAVAILLTAAAGFAMTWKKPKRTVFYLKEGCVATAFSWVLMSIFGCLPFVFSGEIPSFTDALFETISGFTTTGASILPEVESLSRCMLFWRSFTHWIGGMGVLVFLLAILPMTGGSHMNLMRAESPGPSVGKLVPKVKHTARILYLIYVGMTVLQIILLLMGRMPVFDALTTAFGTAGTGGFGIKNDSIMSYSPYIQWIVTIFMLLFAINFNAYYFILYKKWKKALEMEEVRLFLVVVAAAIGLITFNIYNPELGFFHNLRDASFQVASLVSSTGFSSVDFDLWPVVSKTILVMLMFMGACAGSTGGGIKVARLVILFKAFKKEMHSYLHPKSVRKVQMDGKPIEHEVVRATNVYFSTFMLVFAVSLLIISFDGKDLVTNFTAVIATLNNIGPGLNLVGPTCNFSHFSVLSKYVIMFDMLAGRLELFPMLLVCYPPLWKQMFEIRRPQS